MELVPKLWSLKFRKFRIQTWSNLVQVPPVRLSLFRQSIILQSIKLDNFWSAQRAALEGLTHRQMKSPHQRELHTKRLRATRHSTNSQ